MPGTPIVLLSGRDLQGLLQPQTTIAALRDTYAALADNRGDREEHLMPGKGTIDFSRMFARIEGAGYRGHYMCAFGSLDDMVAGRDYLARAAKA